MAIVAVVAIGGFAVGWTLAPKSSGLGAPGFPSATTGTLYGFPIAFSNPQCIVNCRAAVWIQSLRSVVAVNVTDLSVPFVAFQITVTNVGTSVSNLSVFMIYGGEVAGIIYDTSPLNTSAISKTVVQPLAPSPSSADNVTVTLVLAPSTGSSFSAVRGEFFWVSLVDSAGIPSGQWVYRGIPIEIRF